jgi:hypothetical protein
MGPPLIGVTPIFAISFWVSAPTPFPTSHPIHLLRTLPSSLNLNLNLNLNLS